MSLHVVFTHGSGMDLNVRNGASTSGTTIVGNRRYGSVINVRSVINEISLILIFY